MSLGVGYLELVLGLRRLEPELVPDYFGPEELETRIDAEAPATPDELCRQAAELLGQAHDADLEPVRRRWLSAHVDAVVWKPYESCYTDGLALCRQFVQGDPARLERLLAEPLIPINLVRIRT